MKPQINPNIEKVLENTILPDLLRGRKDFDLPHTKAVVFWMKKLLLNVQNPSLDSQVLITAAYAHDWGYIGLFDGVDSTDIEVIHKMKPLHMERGSEKIRSLIGKKLSTYFSKEQQELVSHLVLVHDRIEDLRGDAEIVLMEADTLGMLDTDLVKPTFSKADNDVFIARELNGRRLPVFKHQFAKETAKVLAQKRLSFYD
ncbi:MAG: HD domain-containing protein [Candidatus Woesebacteria bacterium]